MSKIGMHFQSPEPISQPGWPPTPLRPEGGWEDPVDNWMAFCQAGVATILMDEWSPAAAQRLRAVCPKTFIVARLVDHGRSMDNIIRKANEAEGREEGRPRPEPHIIDLLCGGNEGDWSPEPVMDNPADLDKINLIETECATKAHAAGYKYGMGSWSYGATEQLNAAPHRWQYMKEALARADALVIHSYGSNEQYGGNRDRSLDYRKTYADMPTKRPIFIKEFGPAFGLLETVVRGNQEAAGDYLNMLKAWDREWLKDDYLIGVTLWNWDSGKYEGGKHDLNRNQQFTGQLAGYIVNGIPTRKYWTWAPPIVPSPPAPTPAPAPAPTPQPSSWPKRSLWDIKSVAIHHVGVHSPTTPESIERYHRVEKKWPGAAYHVYIRRDGSEHVWWTPEYQVGGIYGDANDKEAYQICLEGNGLEEDLPHMQAQRAWSRIGWIRLVALVGGDALVVKPHRDYPNNTTTCPGKFFERLMEYEPDTSYEAKYRGLLGDLKSAVDKWGEG